MSVRALLAALHVIATDPKVTDHPSCVFTHHHRPHTEQERLACSDRTEGGLDGHKYSMLLPPLSDSPSWPEHTVLSSLWLLNPGCEDQTSFPMSEEDLQQSCLSSSSFS